ncbi:cytochrome P450 [Nannocystis punicea]|uniref:Cytochrome P450 n=1 Tax=Nannocystis punicea TaxID=2995304 RepID=A0ABY7GXY1_9BACT|nr:cytochrome P450 [Nannocystis poenicansa]WAS91745.1 cytochrome P450 [Nannocystis poenicansa]
MSSTFNLLSPDYQADPFPFYARMREEGISRIEPGGRYAVSRYADVLAVLRNTEVFSSGGFASAWEPDWLRPNPCAYSLHSMDPPEHTKMRNLVSAAFLPRTIERTAPLVQGVAEAAARRFLERGEAEIVNDIGLPVTAGTIGHYLRLDPALHPKLRGWSEAMMSIRPVPRSHEHASHVRAAVDEMAAYLRTLIEARRRAPQDDMVSLLVQAEVDGQRLTDAEIVPFLAVLIVGAMDTTTGLMTNAMLHLTERADLLDRLRADPSLVPRFLDEVLRFSPPAHSMARSVKRDTEIAGQKVPAGAVVMAMLAAANRDERQFSNPDVFDIDRSDRGSVAFGHGIHSCIGMALAKMEVRITLGELLPRFRHFDRVGPPAPWNHTYLVRTMTSLRLRGAPA